MGVCCNAATCPGMFQPAPPSFVVPTIGKWLLGLVTLEAFGLIALSAVLFAIHDAATNTGVIYATLGVYCVVASLYFAYDSVLSENMFQYAACHITLSLFTFFIIFQVFHNPYSLGSAWTASRYAIMGVKIGFDIGGGRK
ncbi:hypothetical protein EON62_04440 [archaeon]|nr:MAG: hypothetical protein EON62_04440 [archaeon]